MQARVESKEKLNIEVREREKFWCKEKENGQKDQTLLTYNSKLKSNYKMKFY